MGQINPMTFLQMIQSGQNPQQLMLNFLESQADSPMRTNLFNLAKDNRTAEIEQIARNLCQQRGINYDTEFNSFKQQLGIK